MSFSHFYESWLQKHGHHHLQRLLFAPHHQCPATTEAAQRQQQLLQPMVEVVLAHYHSYFETKARHAELDELDIAAGDRATPLEAAFKWVGWQPTTAFHVFYTESGARFEAQLGDILRRMGSGDLSDISPALLERVGELQLETVRQEKYISKDALSYGYYSSNRTILYA